MMPYGRPDYIEMVERAGLEKAIDLLVTARIWRTALRPGLLCGD